jgi:hypothetical protein
MLVLVYFFIALNDVQHYDEAKSCKGKSAYHLIVVWGKCVVTETR